MKSGTPVTFQVLSSHLWLVATTLDGAYVRPFLHWRKFQQTEWKRKDQGPYTSPSVRNISQRGFVYRSLHLATLRHTLLEPIFPFVNKAQNYWGCQKKT